MTVAKDRAGRLSKRSTSPQADKSIAVQSTPNQHRCAAAKRHRRSWTKEQLSDANFLKVPASAWRNFHDPTRTEYLVGAQDTLTPMVAAAAVEKTPIIGLVRVYEWFWNNSIKTTNPGDTYRYRVIEEATNDTVLPKDETDDLKDDENKIKILFVGMLFGRHVILLLRRICPDFTMGAIESADKWRRFLKPSIREGYSQIRRSAPMVPKRNEGRPV